MEDITLEQYAELVMQANSDKDPVAGDDIDGNPTLLYNYYNEDRDLEYRYLTVLYQADDGFWMVQFASVKDDFDTCGGGQERQLRRISAAAQTQTNRPAANMLPAGRIYMGRCLIGRRLRRWQRQQTNG